MFAPDGPLNGGQETFGVYSGGPLRQVLSQLKGSKLAPGDEVFHGGPHFLRIIRVPVQQRLPHVEAEFGMSISNHDRPSQTYVVLAQEVHFQPFTGEKTLEAI